MYSSLLYFTAGDVPKSFGGSSETATDANGKDEGKSSFLYNVNPNIKFKLLLK